MIFSVNVRLRECLTLNAKKHVRKQAKGKDQLVFRRPNCANPKLARDKAKSLQLSVASDVVSLFITPCRVPPTMSNEFPLRCEVVMSRNCLIK